MTPDTLTPGQRGALTLGRCVAVGLLLLAPVLFYVASQGKATCKVEGRYGDCIIREDTTKAPLIGAGLAAFGGIGLLITLGVVESSMRRPAGPVVQ